jgi:hypothetical protein
MNSTKKIKIFFWPCSENNFYPKFLESKFLFFYLFFLIFLKFIIFPFFIFFPKFPFFAEISKNVMFGLTNKEREKSNVLPLREDPLLTLAAQLKAKDMLERQYFSHQDPEGNPPWEWLKRVGYDFQVAGENLAIGFLDSEEVFSAWMNSCSHRENLLNPRFEEMGIGIAKGNFKGSEVAIVVQFFGTKKPQQKASPKIVTISPDEKIKKETKSNIAKKNSKPALTEKPKEKIFQESTTSQKFVFETSTLRSTTFKTATSEISTSGIAKIEEGPKNFPEKIQFQTFSFLSFKYHKLVDFFIYLNLISIIFILFATIFSDIFLYRKFAIDYVDLLPKTFVFLAVLIILISYDKVEIISNIPHNFAIY